MKRGTRPRGWVAAVLHRWLTWFAVALATLTADDPAAPAVSRSAMAA
ncbi:MAG: hypothetical protein AVDCRST_MAG05-748 [uncultured Rubrobacteraceae bacterium]|uniref:Uncharacterized protein n=1 Tax=uncultured Rubrobacteraceae bacterium TaxID=349277 RepID=A0A6J4RS58_9ACTN|nr:MAG: hypothetical protein AVDCRST_MAG05-748 [uncultured Rubrobacteraceae bacterium]